MNRIISGTLGVCLIISLSFLPVIHGETEREAPTKLTIEIHMPNGIETTKRTVTSEDIEKISNLLNETIEKLKNLNGELNTYQVRKEAGAIISKALHELEKYNININTIPGYNLTKLLIGLNFNLLSLVIGYAKATDRITIGVLLQYALMGLLNNIEFHSNLSKLMNKIISFSMCRPRFLLPSVLCFVWSEIYVATVGLTGLTHIEKHNSGRDPYPEYLSIQGFTGLWISTVKKGRASQSWFIGSALFVI